MRTEYKALICVLLFFIGLSFISLVNAQDSISWSVSSQKDWENSVENDVRIRVQDNISLFGKDAVGWWSMDDDSDTTAHDLTSYGYDGTMNNMGTGDYVSGKFDTGLGFNGSDEYVEIAYDMFTTSSDFCLSGWINVDTTSSEQRYMVLRRNIWTIMAVNQSSSGSLDVYDSNSWHNVGSISTDNWTHIALTYDESSTSFVFYKNGSQIDSWSGEPSSRSGTNTIGIAGWDTSSNPFNGTVDEAFWFDRPLSSDEISRIYNRTEPSSMMGSDLESGTWTSIVKDFETADPQQISSFSTNASIGTGENVSVRISADGSWSDWKELTDGFNQFDNTDIDITGTEFSVEYELESESSLHSPSVDNLSLSVEEAPVKEKEWNWVEPEPDRGPFEKTLLNYLPLLFPLIMIFFIMWWIE